jgi:hypothetical protein
MHRWRRAFWVWVMVWVMPLSGLAATGLPCLMDAAPAAPAAVAATAPCHEAQGMPDDGGALDGAGHHCSACAACLAAAALPPALPAWAAAEPVQALALPPLMCAARLIDGGLDRPPRPAIA